MMGALCVAGSAAAQGERERAGPGGAPYRLRPGAIEAGVAGSLVAVEGSVRADLDVSAGRFAGVGSGLAGYGLEVAYQRVSSLDLLGLEAGLSWQQRLGGSGAYAYAALAAGLRQEWLGSFRQARYPVGPTLGVRVLVSQRAAARIEYRFRRVLNDPVADFSEHQLVAGLSLLFRNSVGRAAD